MDTLAFHFDAYGGWGKVQGMASFDEHGLLLQFTTRDAVFGVLKSGMREIRVPLDALHSLRFRAGFLWLMPAIDVRVRDLSVLQELPESEQGRLHLRVAFGDRREAREFAQELDRLRSLRRIAELDRKLDSLGFRTSTAPITPGQASAGSPLAQGQSSERGQTERFES